MFLQAQWKSARRLERRATRIRTPYGNVDIWLGSIEGREELALLFRAEEPRGYAAPGLLLSVCDHLRALDGEGSTLKLTPVPLAWFEAPVLPYFIRAGFKARLENQSLELRSEMSPSTAIAKSAVLSFALDLFSRSQPELFRKARQLALQHRFEEEILLLLEERSGASRLRKLLGKGSGADETRERDKKVISDLGKTRMKILVHFNPEGGRLLRAVSKNLERAIGIEPSERRAAGKVTGFELFHGSVVEPPAHIPPGSTALVHALPPLGDLRLDRAAEVLFRQIGFEWILCLEGGPALRTWAEDVAEKFGYRVTPALIGADEALVFRRSPASCARTGVQQKQSLEISTRAGLTIGLESRASTLEAFSALTVDPRWLFYLPPETATLQNQRIDGDLEHPKFVFDYYRNEGISKLVVERKDMGSRAVAVICRDDEAAAKRFGVKAPGCIYTRKGRPFFTDGTELLNQFREALCRVDFWRRFETDWVCLEGEILPWTLKAEALIEEHGEILGAGEAMYAEASSVLKRFGAEAQLATGQECFRRYRSLYERYAGAAGKEISFAPFHLIATEGRSFFGMSHLWHMQTLGALVRKAGGPFSETPYRFVTLEKASDIKECITWWSESPGVVIKPLPFVPKGKRGGAQPAFLCRGREHLRFVYGPEYDLPENRLWLSSREALANRKNKRRKVLKQLALSIEGVERFIYGEPLERIEECVRGVLSFD